MNERNAPEMHRIQRAIRQELRTLQLLGIPWAPNPGGSTHPVGEWTEPGVAPKAPNLHQWGERAIAAPVRTAGVAIEPKPDAIGPSRTPPKITIPTTGSKGERLAALRDLYERESVVARLISGWTNIVFADGDPDAALMFVGEAPGEDEDLQGVPFVGRAGKKLNEMIRAMGLARDAVYIANVLKVRPPGNRTPTAEEAALDGPFLLEQISIVRPRVIVTLGKPAAHFLLNETRSMGTLRGQWHEHRGIPVMPTYHPAYLLRAYTPENRQKVWSDLQQVVARLNGSDR